MQQPHIQIMGDLHESVEVAKGYFMPVFPISALKSLYSPHEQAPKLSAPVRESGFKQCLIMTCVKVSSQHSRNVSFENFETDKECSN